MKAFTRRIISMILVITLMANTGLPAFAEPAYAEQKSAGDVFIFGRKPASRLPVC